MLLNEYADPDSAGALMYESAKQCVNAVANQRGTNPGTIGGKINACRSVQTYESDYPDLVRRWGYADKLHIHADRGLLADTEYTEVWEGARAFIDDKLTIYAAA